MFWTWNVEKAQQNQENCYLNFQEDTQDMAEPWKGSGMGVDYNKRMLLWPKARRLFGMLSYLSYQGFSHQYCKVRKNSVNFVPGDVETEDYTQVKQDYMKVYIPNKVSLPSFLNLLPYWGQSVWDWNISLWEMKTYVLRRKALHIPN